MGGLALRGQPAQVPRQAGMGVPAPHWQGASRHSVSSWFSLTAWQISAPSSSSGRALRGSSCVTSECPRAVQGRCGGSLAAPRGAAPRNGLGQGQPQGEVGALGQGAAARTHWADGVALEGLWGSWGESARVGGGLLGLVCALATFCCTSADLPPAPRLQAVRLFVNRQGCLRIWGSPARCTRQVTLLGRQHQHKQDPTTRSLNRSPPSTGDGEPPTHTSPSSPATVTGRGMGTDPQLPETPFPC